MHFVRSLTYTCALALAAGGAAANTLSTSGLSNLVPNGTPEGAACGPVTLTHSTVQTPVAQSSVRCGTPTNHAVNSYFRAYSLGAFPSGFNACAVRFGVETANAGDPATSQPVTVRLFSNTGGAFPAGTRVQVGTVDTMVNDQNLGVVTVPLTATVPAGAELVVEVLTPDGAPGMNSFFLGAGGATETGPSYIQAPACGLAAPATTASINFPNARWILDVIGAGAGSPMLSITSPTVDFNRQATGSVSQRVQTLSNTGNAPLTISALSAPSAPFAQAAGGTCTAVPITLAAGASCTVNYSFTSATEGQFMQTITVTSNGGNGTFALRAQALASIQLPVSSDLGRLALLGLIVGIGLFGLRRRG